jgi:hypothetical protein
MSVNRASSDLRLGIQSGDSSDKLRLEVREWFQRVAPLPTGARFYLYPRRLVFGLSVVGSLLAGARSVRKRTSIRVPCFLCGRFPRLCGACLYGALSVYPKFGSGLTANLR